MLAGLKLGVVGASSDKPNAGNGAADGVPGTNGTWAKFIAGTTITDTALADAGFFEFPYIDAAGAAQTGRIPVFKV